MDVAPDAAFDYMEFFTCVRALLGLQRTAQPGGRHARVPTKVRMDAVGWTWQAGHGRVLMLHVRAKKNMPSILGSTTAAYGTVLL